MLNITKGRVAAPILAAIYGVEGVGKTTLAANLPGALIFDLEGGAKHYDIARVDFLSCLCGSQRVAVTVDDFSKLSKLPMRQSTAGKQDSRTYNIF